MRMALTGALSSSSWLLALPFKEMAPFCLFTVALAETRQFEKRGK
jgi:hypothetical protein